MDSIIQRLPPHHRQNSKSPGDWHYQNAYPKKQALKKIEMKSHDNTTNKKVGIIATPLKKLRSLLTEKR